MENYTLTINLFPIILCLCLLLGVGVLFYGLYKFNSWLQKPPVLSELGQLCLNLIRENKDKLILKDDPIKKIELQKLISGTLNKIVFSKICCPWKSYHLEVNFSQSEMTHLLSYNDKYYIYQELNKIYRELQKKETQEKYKVVKNYLNKFTTTTI